MQIGQPKDFVFALGTSTSSNPSSSPSPSHTLEYSVDFTHHLLQDPTQAKVTINNSQVPFLPSHTFAILKSFLLLIFNDYNPIITFLMIIIP
jgi:hypothetical protein